MSNGGAEGTVWVVLTPWKKERGSADTLSLENYEPWSGRGWLSHCKARPGNWHAT